MNFNKILKITLQCIMTSILLSITYYQLRKLHAENIGFSYSFLESNEGVDLPSFTICTYEFTKHSPIMKENITFEEYMKVSINAKKFIIKGHFRMSIIVPINHTDENEKVLANYDYFYIEKWTLKSHVRNMTLKVSTSNVDWFFFHEKGEKLTLVDFFSHRM